jgi:AraC family transcriptional regulator
MPPHRYVLKRRIERARRLLEQPDISIAEVAYSCGFRAKLTWLSHSENSAG